MQELLNDDTYMDISFELDSGLKIKAHRCILAVCNVEWFRVLLKSKFKEVGEQYVRVQECEDKVFQLIINQAYNIESIQTCDYQILFKAASMFLCPDLIKQKIYKSIKIDHDFLIMMYNYSPVFDNFLIDLHKTINYSDLYTKIQSLNFSEDHEDFIEYIISNTDIYCRDYNFITIWVRLKGSSRRALDWKNATKSLLKKTNMTYALHQQNWIGQSGLRKIIDDLLKYNYLTVEEADKYYSYILTFRR